MKKLFWVCFFMIFFTGCSSIWSKVTYLWEGRFLKVDTKISQKRWKLPRGEKKIADTFYNFDTELDQLINIIETLSIDNFEQKSNIVLSQRPWILGIYIMESKNGQVSLRKQRGEKLCIAKENINDLYSKETLNPISYLISKNKLIIVNRQRNGEDNYYLISIVVDLKNLAFHKCNLLQKFGIVADNHVIIGNGINTANLSGIHWNSLIKKQIKGIIHTRKANFYWLVRFLGEKPIFYLIKL